MEDLDKPRVIVFGGSFNPPTVAHANIMETCLNLPDFDEVWVMPSGEREDKQMSASDEHRLNMLEFVKSEIFEDDPRLKISDFELRLPRPTETINTIGRLLNKYSNVEFWFAFGVDAYEDMRGWLGGVILESELNMIIFERDGIKPPNRDGIIDISLPECDSISSTRVREALASGELISDLVCSGVEKYIRDLDLYRSVNQPVYES